MTVVRPHVQMGKWRRFRDPGFRSSHILGAEPVEQLICRLTARWGAAQRYEVSRQWVHQLVNRYQGEGTAAFRPRPRRPHSNSRAVSAEVEHKIVRVRKTLTKSGLDAASKPPQPISEPTSIRRICLLYPIWRILSRRGFISHNRTNIPVYRVHRRNGSNPRCPR